ncbi:MAG TPA: LolA family protein [Candidatus Wujingus californicus]|nr:DUF4292 domain-containing protein [Planctomycetota bacterium]
MQNGKLNFKKMMRLYIIVSILSFQILASGCATYKTQVTQKLSWEDTSSLLRNVQGDVKNLSRQQITENLILNSSKIATLRANIDITLTTPDAKAPLRCNGLILYQNPNHLRAMGSKLATTLFDIYSDERKFYLYIPIENKVYTGSSNAFHKIEVLGINIFPGDMAYLFNHREILEGYNPVIETWPFYWLLHLMEAKETNINLKGNLLIDRINADVFRCELFEPDGAVRLQILFTNYVSMAGGRVPQRIDVRWPKYDTTLNIIFSDVILNKKLDPKVFSFAKSEGAEVITLD